MYEKITTTSDTEYTKKRKERKGGPKYKDSVGDLDLILRWCYFEQSF